MAWLQPPAHFVMQGDDFWLPFKPFDYQFEGIQFLNSRWQAILADEMGLGKTMQTIVAMRLLIRAGQAKSALLVCPKPLVTNWQRELHLWADDIRLRSFAATVGSEKVSGCMIAARSSLSITRR